MGGDLRPDPPKSEGILKTPRAPRRGSEGRILEGLRGSVAKIPDKKPESYAYFFIHLLLQANTATLDYLLFYCVFYQEVNYGGSIKDPLESHIPGDIRTQIP